MIFDLLCALCVSVMKNTEFAGNAVLSAFSAALRETAFNAFTETAVWFS
jgi:hypothetical protein